MATDWLAVLATKAAAWGISAAEVAELTDLVQDAQSALAQAKNESTRTPAATALCKERFKRMIEKMRYDKNHFFLSPPLTPSEIVSLGLKPHDTNPSPIPPPKGFAEADISYPGVGTLELHCRPVAGQPPLDERSDYGYRVYYGVMPVGGASAEDATGTKRELVKAPQTGADLPHSQWVRRKRERFSFPGDSGKTVWIAIRYENSKGQSGPWGPLTSAIIP
jgi:hypothetical protein